MARSEFIEYLKLGLKSAEFQKIILSKPSKGYDYIRLEVLPVESKYKLSKKSKTQDFTSMHDAADLESLLTLELGNFLAANLWIQGKHISLLTSKSGKKSLIVKNDQIALPIANNEHNRAKNYLIPPDKAWLTALGVSGSNGQVLAPMQKKYRQINRFVELIEHTIGETVPHKIADMGSGKAYLSFALYDYLQSRNEDISLTGYELRPELVALCNKHADNLGFTHLNFVEANILEADTGPLDMLIALHACDTATDMAIKKGLDAGARFIVLSPCCHKQIRKQMNVQDSFTEHGIYEERIAEMVTDTIRSLILRHYGYKTSIIEFISAEHTGKNSMIIAKKTGIKDGQALGQIASLKSRYGIGFHYLEKLCGLSANGTHTDN